jgi:hypothetical protein
MVGCRGARLKPAGFPSGPPAHAAIYACAGCGFEAVDKSVGIGVGNAGLPLFVKGL